MTEIRIEKLWKYPLEDGEIVDILWKEGVEAPESNPLGIHVENPGSYYRVTMKLHPTQQSDITVVVLLPEPELWNGKFLGTGNGGFAGTIAEGALLGGISRRYAVANTDMGMAADPDDSIGRSEVWADFGYRATHLMTEAGKGLAAFFYGREPEHAYFIGGSTGGQQGFSEAQRYQEDYDGIVCLSPAFDRVRLHAFFIWNWQQIHGRENAVFTPEQAKDWKDSVVKVYREECGSNAEDAFLVYPGRIRENPMDNPALQEAAGKLTEGQWEALRELYDGPRDPVTGERFIAHFLPGTEAEGLSLADISNRDSFAHDFFYPFRWLWGKDFDFMKFDFHKDLQEAIRKLGPVLDADNPDMAAFRDHGGKLLVVGGSMDAIIPYTGFMEYYRKVADKQGSMEETMQFFRFLLMPGFSHTIGGAGVQEVGMLGITEVPRDSEHDVICAMERWCEQGIAPERLLGTHFEMGDRGLKFGYARPAYVYPYMTEYIGGNPCEPENYRPVKAAEVYG